MPAPQVQRQHHHRSSVKQQKSFKSGKHSSKSALKEAAKGVFSIFFSDSLLITLNIYIILSF